MGIERVLRVWPFDQHMISCRPSVIQVRIDNCNVWFNQYDQGLNHRWGLGGVTFEGLGIWLALPAPLPPLWAAALCLFFSKLFPGRILILRPPAAAPPFLVVVCISLPNFCQPTKIMLLLFQLLVNFSFPIKNCLANVSKNILDSNLAFQINSRKMIPTKSTIWGECSIIS